MRGVALSSTSTRIAPSDAITYYSPIFFETSSQPSGRRSAAGQGTLSCQFSRMVARGGQPKPEPAPVGDGGGALATAALRFGERPIGRSSRAQRSGDSRKCRAAGGRPATMREPVMRVSATSTGLAARAVVSAGMGRTLDPAPYPVLNAERCERSQ
jgi:hypothetical protein